MIIIIIFDCMYLQVVAAMPTRGRKRFVSEGDGGRLKEC